MSRDIYKQTHYIYATSLGINMVDEATPNGVMHISEGSAGSYSMNQAYNNLVVEGSAYPGVTAISTDGTWSGFVMGSPADTHAGRILYNNSASGNITGGPEVWLGTATANGAIVFQTANGVQAMTIDSSQNVGINTNTPNRGLHVYGKYIRIGEHGTYGSTPSSSVEEFARIELISNANSGNVQSVLQCRNSGTYSGVQLGTTSTHDVRFLTNNSARMTLDSTGKIGVNTTSPTALMHLNNPIDIPAIHLSSVSDSEGSIGYSATDSFTLGTYDGSTFTEKMRIDTAGEVGIGTTAPGARLHVAEASSEQLRLAHTTNYVSLGCTSGTDLEITSNSDTDDSVNLYMNQVRISDSGTGSGNLYMGSSGNGGNIRDGGGAIRIAILDDGDLQLRDDGGTTRMVVGSTTDTHAGGIGIGTNDPDYDLHVSGTQSSSYIAMIDNTSTGSNADVLALRTGSTTSTSVGSSNNFIQFQDGNGDTMGSIEGSTGSQTSLWGTTETAGNIILMGAGSDYGEWLPVANINDWPNTKNIPDKRLVGIEEGTVVFVKNGLINPKPPGLPMVVTERSIITGNSPGGRGYSGQPGAVLSFIGQVFVKISGDTKEGDFIVPSDSYGTCRAVSRDSITFEDYINSIGVTLEDGLSGYDVSKVRCAIGVKNRYHSE